MAKITEDQLKSLNDFTNDRHAILSDIGVLEARKHGLLHMLSKINVEESKFMKELEEQYGKISVNLEDGSYKEREEESKIDG
jgi:hypothetical protein